MTGDAVPRLMGSMGRGWGGRGALDVTTTPPPTAHGRSTAVVMATDLGDASADAAIAPEERRPTPRR